MIQADEFFKIVQYIGALIHDGLVIQAKLIEHFFLPQKNMKIMIYYFIRN